MANNVDLIQIVSSTGGGLSACSDCSDTFLAKDNGVFGGYIADATSSEKTKWAISGDTATFTLGKLTSTDIGTLTVQGSTDSDAIVYVKSNDGSTTSITPTTITVENIAGSPVSALGATTVTGNVLPNANDTYDLGSSLVRWHNLYVENVDLDGTLSVSDLTLSGNLTANGNTVLGNAAGDTLDITATTTFNTPFSVVSGAGAVEFNNNNINTTGIGAITTLDTDTGTIDTLTVTNAPSADNHAVRRTDVNIGTSTTLALTPVKVAVTNGYITDVQALTAGDTVNHATRHHSTSRTSSAPAADGQDPINSYQIGAVERANPVVKQPLKIISSSSSNDYTYAQAVNYFVVIENDDSPAASGPEGQIIFRKANP
jgi:hypothetical protein